MNTPKGPKIQYTKSAHTSLKHHHLSEGKIDDLKDKQKAKKETTQIPLLLKLNEEEQKIIDAAMKRLSTCTKAEQHNRAAAIEDLKFANGDQWDTGERKRRSDKGRPCLQFNLLQKFVDQVVGDMLHNSPSIKIRPVDSKADVNIAKIRQGIINNIEYQEQNTLTPNNSYGIIKLTIEKYIVLFHIK